MDDTALRANFWKLKAIRVLFWMHFFGAISVPFYVYGAHLNLFQIFLLQSWFLLWNEGLKRPATSIGDFFGYKWALTLSPIAGGLASLLYASRPDFPTFLVGTVLFAASYNLALASDTRLGEATLLDLGEEGRAQPLRGQLGWCKLGGTAVGALAGGFLALRSGLIAPWVAYAIPAAAAMVVALSLREPRAQVSGAEPGFDGMLSEGWPALRSDRGRLVRAVETAFLAVVIWSLFILFQALLSRTGMGIEYFGVVYAVALAAQTAVIQHASKLAGIVGSQKLLSLSAAFLAGLAFIDLAVVDHPFLVSLGVIVAFAAGFPRLLWAGEAVAATLPAETKEVTGATVHTLQIAALILVQPLIGWMADWNLSHTMMILGVLLIAGTLVSRVEEGYSA